MPAWTTWIASAPDTYKIATVAALLGVALEISRRKQMSYFLRGLARSLWPSAASPIPPISVRDGCCIVAESEASGQLANEGRLCWIDLEMTGLDPVKDRILEIACVVTDRNLNPLDKGVSYVVKTPKNVLDEMGEWCTEQHGRTGLTQDCLDAPHSMAQVERLVLSYVRERMPSSGQALLAGSSVHVDKIWLRKDMPRLHAHLHYRICDVSTIKELMLRWDPTFLTRREAAKAKEPPSDGVAHRAMADIRWSIEGASSLLHVK